MSDILTARLPAVWMTGLALALAAAALPGCAAKSLPVRANIGPSTWCRDPLACPHCGCFEHQCCCRPNPWNHGYHCPTWSRLEPCCTDQLPYETVAPGYPDYQIEPAEQLPSVMPGDEPPLYDPDPPLNNLDEEPLIDSEQDTSRRQPAGGILLDPNLRDVGYWEAGSRRPSDGFQRLPPVESPRAERHSRNTLRDAGEPHLLELPTPEQPAAGARRNYR